MCTRVHYCYVVWTVGYARCDEKSENLTAQGMYFYGTFEMIDSHFPISLRLRESV